MWYNVIITRHNTHPERIIAMIHYNTLGNNLKRGILRFAGRISMGLKKPARKFVANMLYGVIASNSSKLTEIGRALKEDISLKKTVDRLGRNLKDFSETETVMSHYLEEIRPTLGADTMLLIDGGDATKSCSPKMEAIGSVKDGSTGKFADGYWTMGVAALSEGNRHPLPVYEKLYPCKKQGGLGFKAETSAALTFIRRNFESSIPRLFDRGFDSGETLKDLLNHEEKFILRVNQNRVCVHKGEMTKINDVVRGLECQHMMTFHSKTGNTSTCKIGMTQINLPNVNNTQLFLVVCKGIGENPLVLYTNIDENIETLAARIVKAYLMRWRIEEYYAFKKQGLRFENFRVRSLRAIQTLDLLLTIAVGYIGTLCADANENMLTVELIAASMPIPKLSVFLQKTKFLFYAVLIGITCVLAQLRKGISSHFAPVKQHQFTQLCLPTFEILG